jgi:hypothetical protein
VVESVQALEDGQNLSGPVQICGWQDAGNKPQKAMTVGYFAEIKGLVGYQYHNCLAFKVRDLNRF